MKTAAFSAAELRFWGWIPRAPDLSDFYAKGRGGLQPGASRDCRPPWGPPESRPRRWEFRTAKRESRLRRPDFFTAKCESRQRRSPLPGRGFFGRAAGRNGALPYNARKSQFLRNGDVRATESLFLFAVLWLAFLPGQSETGVAGGGKARRPETPAAPRRPAQRPRPAPGFCAASANARPGDPAPVRLLEKALWAPPTTEPFRKAPSGKPERERQTKGGSLNATSTPGLARPLRLRMAGRAPSRNAPSVAESPQNQHRRSAP